MALLPVHNNYLDDSSSCVGFLLMEKPFFGKRSRADALKEKSPQLIADVFLYATQDGGKKLTVQPGWGCPCSLSKPKDALPRRLAATRRAICSWRAPEAWICFSFWG